LPGAVSADSSPIKSGDESPHSTTRFSSFTPNC
jgi:hypothetical protein